MGKPRIFVCVFFIAGLEKCLIMPLDIYSIYPQHNEIYFAKKRKYRKISITSQDFNRSRILIEAAVT